jgi:hypothetical protein
MKLNPVDADKVAQTNGDYTVNSAFNKLIDYIKLDVEKGDMQMFVEAMTDFKNRDEWAARHKQILDDFDNNKQAYIKSALDAFDQKRVSDEMLNELYENGLFFDLKELDALLEEGVMPDEIFNINDNSIASEEQLKQAQEIIGKYVSKLKNLNLISSDKGFSLLNKRRTDDTRTTSEIMESYGLTYDSEIDLSSSEGLDFLAAMMDAQMTTQADDVILVHFMESNYPLTIKFSEQQDRPIDIEDNVITIDLRYAGSEYNGTEFTGFEQLVVRAISQKIIYDNVSAGEYGPLLQQIMSEVKEYLKERIPVNAIPFLNNPEAFLVEVLNNAELQLMLKDMNLSTALDNTPAWDDLSAAIGITLQEQFNGKALQKILGVAKEVLEPKTNADTGASVQSVPVSETVVAGDQASDDQSMAEDQAVEPEAQGEETSQEDQVSRLKDELQSAYRELQQINAEKESAGFLRKRSLNRKALSVGVKINKLLDQIQELETEMEDQVNEYAPYTSPTAQPLPAYSNNATTDVFGNELMTPQTPWKEMAPELKEELVAAYTEGERSSKTIDRATLTELLNDLQTDPELQAIVKKYNDDLTSESEKRFNEDAMLKLKQQRASRQRMPKKGSKQKRTFTSLEHLSRMFKNEPVEVSLLTEEEATDILRKINETRNTAIPYTTADIVAYIQEKKLTAEIKKQKKTFRKQGKERIERMARERKIKENLNTVIGEIRTKTVTVDGKTMKLKMAVSMDLLGYLAQRHSKVFASDNFQEEFDRLMDQVFQTTGEIKKYLSEIDFTTTSPETVFVSYMAAGTLYPDAVKAFNTALMKADIPLVIKSNRRSGTVSYKLTNVKRKLSAEKAKPKAKQQRDYETLGDYLDSGLSSDLTDLTKKVLLARIIRDKGLSQALVDKYAANNYKADSRKSFIKPKGLLSFDSVDTYLGDYLISNEGGFLSPEDVRFVGDEAVFLDLLTRYSTVNKMLEGVAKEAKEYLQSLNEEETGDLPQGSQDESDFVDFVDYLNSAEGSTYVGEMLRQEDEYYRSVEYKIENGLYNGSYETLSPEQKLLYNKAVTQELYDQSEISLQQALTEMNALEAELVELQRSSAYQTKDQDALDRETEINETLAFYQDLIAGLTKDATVETKSFDDLLGEPTAIAKESAVVMNMIPRGAKSYEIVAVASRLLKESGASFERVVSARLLGQGFNVNESQKISLDRAFNNAVSRMIGQNPYVIMAGVPYRMSGVSGTSIKMVDMSGSEKTFTLNEIERDFEKMGVPGDIIPTSVVNPVVNVNQIPYIKETYLQILNTFDSAQISDEESVIRSLKDHLKTCT